MVEIQQSEELGTMEMNETKIGRLEHKIAKLETLGKLTPGIEMIKAEAFSGDNVPIARFSSPSSLELLMLRRWWFFVNGVFWSAEVEGADSSCSS